MQTLAELARRTHDHTIPACLIFSQHPERALWGPLYRMSRAQVGNPQSDKLCVGTFARLLRKTLQNRTNSVNRCTNRYYLRTNRTNHTKRLEPHTYSFSLSRFVRFVRIFPTVCTLVCTVCTVRITPLRETEVRVLSPAWVL